MLNVEGLNSYYDQSHILHNVSLKIKPGEIVVLLGRNGVGKTTTMKSIMGIVKPSSGKVTYNGNDITGMKAHKIANMGISFVPEERRIFQNLSVLENLKMGAVSNNKKLNFEERLYIILNYFPKLKERIKHRGDRLSGGEQQMLTLARGLISKPDLMLIDEPTEGLSPIVVQEISQIIRQLQADGVTMMIVEQNYKMSLSLSHNLRAYIMEKGQIKMSGTPRELAQHQDDVEKCLGVKI